MGTVVCGAQFETGHMNIEFVVTSDDQQGSTAQLKPAAQ